MLFFFKSIHRFGFRMSMLRNVQIAEKWRFKNTPLKCNEVDVN